MRTALGLAHAAWQAAGSALRDLEQLRSRGKREQEYLLWQLDELRKADLQSGEDEARDAERNGMRQAARLAEPGQAADERLHEAGVARAAAAMGSAASLDARRTPHATRLEELAEEISDLAAPVRRYTVLIGGGP